MTILAISFGKPPLANVAFLSVIPVVGDGDDRVRPPDLDPSTERDSTRPVALRYSKTFPEAGGTAVANTCPPNSNHASTCTRACTQTSDKPHAPPLKTNTRSASALSTPFFFSTNTNLQHPVPVPMPVHADTAAPRGKWITKRTKTPLRAWVRAHAGHDAQCAVRIVEEFTKRFTREGQR
ncbi:hypothetical protein BC826DRAFT_1106092 [Russula brevipes]|nr:hypothetical protein BC826DRAFT_1106092 [Russula brevipes]